MVAETGIHDVAIVGAGLAGTALASALLRDGLRVALIDARASHPREFRAEKLGAGQMERFQALGLGDSVGCVATPMDDLWVVRYGRLVSRERKREYGFSYADLVNRLRADLSTSHQAVIGRVDDIATGPGGQTVRLTDGRQVRARLVVLSTGLGDAVRRKLGITRTVISPQHSLSIGFDMRSPRASFPFETLTYYAETFGTRAAYLTLFPLGSAMRANLFVYRGPADAWTEAFLSEPEAGLRALLPRLPRICPDLAVGGRVEARPIDLARAELPARDGIVLVGDAYLTACPIPGTGINKVLTDVERLRSVYIPRWLASPTVDRAAVSSFYADPIKAANDAESLRMSRYARHYGTSAHLAWAARRARHRVLHQIRHSLGRPVPDPLSGGAAIAAVVPFSMPRTPSTERAMTA
ncbi:FAD-dependent oxidoreductase [Lichenibacterium dinghuense]|uniref:FAD-dependent oxidoreductase n=1 Tax=Lichenibacterium dinghuense TaxID=2895977 RepID=UPI001F1E81BD|nr:NAD(P)/FAD-dependent oxidoreductase [Lichenibacterium sp. 6Y81]